MRVVTVREMLVSEGYDPLTIVPPDWHTELNTLVCYEKDDPIHDPYLDCYGRTIRKFPIRASEFKWGVILGATEKGYGKSFVICT